MKVLVAYYSDSGNTEKVAKAIYEELSFVEKRMTSIKEQSSSHDYEVLFLGFPVQNHSIPSRVEKFLKKIPAGKKIAFFATHGSFRGGEFAVTAFYYAMSLTATQKVLGTFGCRGEVKARVLEKLMKRPQDRYWAMEAQSAAGHPDDGDLADARKWSWWMLMKAQSL
jgi:flavodoxin I